MKMPNTVSDAVFFLGAGASVPAGVPDTYTFVRKYIKHIKNRDKKKTIEKIVEILEQWKGATIDVELLLETLTKLESQDKEPLLNFFENKRYLLGGYYDKSPLIDDLKDFIKAEAIVAEDKIRYLNPLLEFLGEFGSLDIISVNYDSCIEQFCNVHKLTYQDGFDVFWNPATFTSERTNIRLYKLHGSVMWYQSDRGGYIKLPVMKETSKIQLITGERADNLMLYPMQKWDYAEPLLELLLHVKRLLESETCKFLVVVGYSFRDDHIIRILWDAARKNRELLLILVDPNAHQIYTEKLKYYDSACSIPSSLSGRVVCLPYLFDKVFPYIKNYYLRNLREGLRCEDSQRQLEIKGEKVNLGSCLMPFVNAEYIERTDHLLSRIDLAKSESNWDLHLLLNLKMALNLSANKQKKRAKKYYNSFYEFLHSIFVTRLNANVTRDPLSIRIDSAYYYPDRPAGYISMDHLKKTVETLFELSLMHLHSLLKISEDTKKISEILRQLKSYFDIFKFDRIRGIDVENYITLRQKMIADIGQFRGDVKKLQSDFSQHTSDKLKKTILEVEKQILKKVFKKYKV